MMGPDEARVKSYLKNCALTVERFSKAETRAGKTPDFRVFQNGEFLAYCEVKSSPKDQWLDDKLDNAAPGELVGGARSDPIFNRLTNDIHEAMKQFDAVNEGQKHPNILALVNHDNACGFNDLLAILTGNFYAKDGMVHPIYGQFSDGRIKYEKEKVHLFIWLDDHKPNRWLLNRTDEAHRATLCAAFGFGPDEIKIIGH